MCSKPLQAALGPSASYPEALTRDWVLMLCFQEDGLMP